LVRVAGCEDTEGGARRRVRCWVVGLVAAEGKEKSSSMSIVTPGDMVRVCGCVISGDVE